MITSLFLTIPPGTTYEQLKYPIHFHEDFIGVSNWVMRLPRFIYSTDLTHRHVFTEGNVHIESISHPQLEDKWKYFVITRSDGRRYYCTAQVYYQKTPLKYKEAGLFSGGKESYREFYLPRCLVLLSEMPYYKIQVNLLKVYRELKKAEPIISFSINETLYKAYLFLKDSNRQSEWQYITVRQNGKDAKRINCSIQFAFNYYLSLCNEHVHGQAIYIEKATNRQVLHLYKLYSHSVYEISYFFHLPFTSNILRIIISAILMEKQIIFVCQNQNLNTLIIETLMKMILPLKWCYMYVPNLPSHILQPAQQSFMPYIVGVNKKNLAHIDTVGTTRVVIHVQQNQVSYDQNLLLFDQSLEELLQYINTDDKNYLEWEKQIRVKSLQLITTLIQEGTRKQANTSRNLQEHKQFMNDFVQNSMMFKHFKEDLVQGLAIETNEILAVPHFQRRKYLSNKFNMLSSQAQYPDRYDNEKKWIRYYERVTRNKRKVRFTRYSMNSNENSLHQSSVTNMSMSQLGSSRIVSTQSTIFI